MPCCLVLLTISLLDESTCTHRDCAACSPFEARLLYLITIVFAIKVFGSLLHTLYLSTMTTNSTSCSLGTILVTGGCGFLGFHLVGHLLQEPEHGPIYVLSRAPTKNLQDNVTYRAGDVTNAQKLAALLEEIKPKVIFHTASPAFMGSVSAQQFYDTNIKGTKATI